MTDAIWLFGEIEVSPKLTYEEMLEEIPATCGTITGTSGDTKLIIINDNDAARYFRLEYNTLERGQKEEYRLTKIDEWKREEVWSRDG